MDNPPTVLPPPAFGPYHQLINARVTMMAVNIEVMMPMLKVTANPLIGPVPKLNSTTAAISVVMLASTMVDNARS